MTGLKRTLGQEILFFFKEGLVPITIPKFSKFPFVPARDLGEVTGDPCNAIDILRSTIGTRILKAPAGPVAGVARGEFRRKSDLIILGLVKGLHHEIGQRGPRRPRFAQPDMGQRSSLDERMEESLLSHAFDRVEHRRIVKIGRVGIVDLASRNVSLDNMA